jgi:hypothetical protein
MSGQELVVWVLWPVFVAGVVIAGSYLVARRIP